MKEIMQNMAKKVKPLVATMIMLVLLILLFALNSENFLSLQNALNVLDQTAAMMILAIGLTFVLIGGNFDVSGGSCIALTGMICAKMLVWGVPVVLTIIAGILCGGLIGLFNGLCVAKLKLSSFILTLTTSIMAEGIAFAISGGQTIYGLPDSFCFWGSGRVAGIPVPIILVLVLFVVFHLLLSRTVFGHQVYALGENEEAALLSGIQVDWVTVGTFVIAGCLYGVAAISLTGRLSAAVSTNGLDMEMTALSGLAIGGISMAGGRGNLIGAFLGCLIIGVLTNGLNMLNLSPYYAEFIRGLVIFLALVLEGIREILSKKGK